MTPARSKQDTTTGLPYGIKPSTAVAGATALPAGLLAKLLVDNPSTRRYMPNLDDYTAQVVGGATESSPGSIGVQAKGFSKLLGRAGVHTNYKPGWQNWWNAILDNHNYDATIHAGNSPASLSGYPLLGRLADMIPSPFKAPVTGRLFTDVGEGSLAKNQPFREWTGGLNGMRVSDPKLYDLTFVPGYAPGAKLPDSVAGAKGGAGIGNTANDPAAFAATPYSAIKGEAGRPRVVVSTGGGAGIPLMFTDTGSMATRQFDVNKPNVMDDIISAAKAKYGNDVDVVWHTGLDKPTGAESARIRKPTPGSPISFNTVGSDIVDQLHRIKNAQPDRYKNLTLKAKVPQEEIAKDFSTANHVVGLGGSTLGEMASMPGEHLPHGITIIHPDKTIAGMTGHWATNYEHFKEKLHPGMDMVDLTNPNRATEIGNSFNKAAPLHVPGRQPYLSDASAAADTLKKVIRESRTGNLGKLKLFGGLTALGGGGYALAKYLENKNKRPIGKSANEEPLFKTAFRGSKVVAALRRTLAQGAGQGVIAAAKDIPTASVAARKKALDNILRYRNNNGSARRARVNATIKETLNHPDIQAEARQLGIDSVKDPTKIKEIKQARPDAGSKWKPATPARMEQAGIPTPRPMAGRARSSYNDPFRGNSRNAAWDDSFNKHWEEQFGPQSKYYQWREDFKKHHDDFVKARAEAKARSSAQAAARQTANLKRMALILVGVGGMAGLHTLYKHLLKKGKPATPRKNKTKKENTMPKDTVKTSAKVAAETQLEKTAFRGSRVAEALRQVLGAKPKLHLPGSPEEMLQAGPKTRQTILDQLLKLRAAKQSPKSEELKAAFNDPATLAKTRAAGQTVAAQPNGLEDLVARRMGQNGAALKGPAAAPEQMVEAANGVDAAKQARQAKPPPPPKPPEPQPAPEPEPAVEEPQQQEEQEPKEPVWNEAPEKSAKDNKILLGLSAALGIPAAGLVGYDIATKKKQQAAKPVKKMSKKADLNPTTTIPSFNRDDTAFLRSLQHSKLPHAKKVLGAKVLNVAGTPVTLGEMEQPASKLMAQVGGNLPQGVSGEDTIARFVKKTAPQFNTELTAKVKSILDMMRKR